jgi:hypothetical protein
MAPGSKLSSRARAQSTVSLRNIEDVNTPTAKGIPMADSPNIIISMKATLAQQMNDMVEEDILFIWFVRKVVVRFSGIQI